ncbi:MAG: hypothetical protein Q7S34_02640 [bacterium]|nr:hypothetical protein [bacterium]
MKETFYRKPDGKFAFHAIGLPDAERAGVFAENKRRYEQGYGWPKNSPASLGREIIWDAFTH